MSDSRVVYQRGDYIVKEIEVGYYLYNRKRQSEYEHTHIKTEKTCRDFIDMIYRSKVPDSPYLRESILRVCKDKKLIDDVLRKIEKDKQKPKFIKVQKGVKR